MSVKLGCDRGALNAWWQAVSTHDATLTLDEHPTICEILK